MVALKWLGIALLVVYLLGVVIAIAGAVSVADRSMSVAEWAETIGNAFIWPVFLLVTLHG